MRKRCIVILTLVLEAIHKSELEQILLVEIVDSLLGLRIVDLACPDVSVENLICEAEFVFV